MTNYEWLLQMSGDERQAWFDAEHESCNQYADQQKFEPVRETHKLDSREKLEADVRNHIAISIKPNKGDDGVLAPVQTVLGWLDRQAAITELEVLERYQGGVVSGAFHAEERERWIVKNAELRDKVYVLTAMNEELREKLGCAIDHAHGILTLVDLEGNVLS